MADLTALLTLLSLGAAALVIALFRARRKGRTDATRNLELKDAEHAQSIAETVARDRADRRVVDAQYPLGFDPADRLPADQPLGKRGWRD